MHAAAHLVGAWPMTRYLLALCLMLALPSFASTWKDGGGWASPPMTQGSDGVYTVLPDMSSPNNSHSTVCTPSSCNRNGDLPAPRGRGNPRLTPTAVFPKGALVTGALALGRNMLPWLVTGKALYDWYKAANMQVDPDTGEPGEMSGAQESASGYYYFGSGNSNIAAQGNFSTEAAAVQLVKSWNQIPSGSTFLSWVYEPAYGVNQGCGVGKGSFLVKNNTTGAQTSYCSTYQVGRGSLTQTACADVSTKKIMGNATGGLCPSGTFQPLTQTAAADRLNNANVSGDVLRRALEEILKAGGSLQDTGSHSVIGPSSVPGETKTKTTTAANGTTQVTTVTNNYNYNYAGNTITITTTEVIQNPDGSTETTTSDTPDPLCADNPTSLACIKLGDVPTDQPAWETKTIAYQADSLGLPAACPAPWTGQLRGWTLSFSYQPACDVAPQIRLAILALTTLGALLMIVTTVRT